VTDNRIDFLQARYHYESVLDEGTVPLNIPKAGQRTGLHQLPNAGSHNGRDPQMRVNVIDSSSSSYAINPRAGEIAPCKLSFPSKQSHEEL
jgi:hypothetical protein